MNGVQAGRIWISWNDAGWIDRIIDCKDQRDILPAGKSQPILRIVRHDKIYAPDRLEQEPEDGLFRLEYRKAGVLASLRIRPQQGYATFELAGLTGEAIDTALWGPFPSIISQTIGEIVGVVRDENLAFGIQALNGKTQGGWPEEWVEAGYDDLSPGDPLFGVSTRGHRYCDCTAAPTAFGSVLQAFCRDRSRLFVRNTYGAEHVPVVPLAPDDADACMTGSRIALFGCDAVNALERIGEIELAEGLPHPLLDGEWAKTARAARKSYLITAFSEDQIDEAIAYTSLAGLESLYHPDPFTCWGHFMLRPDAFPDGDVSMQRCVARAADRGVRLGVHTLTTFTTTHDPYVTPVPDPHLAKVGTATLTADIGKDDSRIPVSDPAPFRLRQWLSTVQIGHELIRYGGLSDTEPWQLLSCERGLYGTAAAVHQTGSAVSKLWDHAYKVFFPDIILQDCYSDRLGALFCSTGLGQISFDGLEGCMATGHERYATGRMVERCWRAWQDGGCTSVINDASQLDHWLWHIHTRMNWGEPWGAAMREGQMEARWINQRFFARNLFPRMLGWFLIRLSSRKFAATTQQDLEWALSKAAGFDAGFALSVDMHVLRQHGLMDVLLDTVKQWEQVRNAGILPEHVRERLRDVSTEWHLEPDGELAWKLYPLHMTRELACMPEELQPGQPGGSDWHIINPCDAQPLRFILRVPAIRGVADARIMNPSFTVDNRAIVFETVVPAGCFLVCTGQAEAIVYDADWHQIHCVTGRGHLPRITAGAQGISFSAEFAGEETPDALVRFHMMGQPEHLAR